MGKEINPQVECFGRTSLSSTVSSVVDGYANLQENLLDFQKKKEKKQTCKMKSTYPTAAPRELFTLQATNLHGLLLLIVLYI